MKAPEQAAEQMGLAIGTRVLPGPDQGLPEALYIHIPFCLSRCHYCDFVTYTTLRASIDPYIEALAAEISGIRALSASVPPLRTLYLGGGTPSLLASHHLESIRHAIQEVYELGPELEFTLEANPGDLSQDLLAALRQNGVNRLSLGMQSANDAELRLLGRRHTHEKTRQAVHLARLSGFDNLSLDLIYGLPGQTLGDWAANVEAALRLEPEHLSAYCLTIEAGTRLQAQVRRGEVEPASDDAAAEMLEWLASRLSQAGYARYEISNWARGGIAADGHPRFACRHNLTYWRNRPYLGVGAGAHGYWAGVRYANVTRVADYIGRFRAGAAAPRGSPRLRAASWSAPVGEEEASRDTLLLGLRLTAAGVRVDEYVERHGLPAWEKQKPALDRLERDGLVEWAEGGRRVRLTERGCMLANRVFAEFV